MRQSTKVVTIRNVVIFAIILGMFVYNVYWDNYYFDWDESWLASGLFVAIACPAYFVISLISTLYTVKERDYSRRDNCFIAINVVCTVLALGLEFYYVFVCMF